MSRLATALISLILLTSICGAAEPAATVGTPIGPV